MSATSDLCFPPDAEFPKARGNVTLRNPELGSSTRLDTRMSKLWHTIDVPLVVIAIALVAVATTAAVLLAVFGVRARRWG